MEKELTLLDKFAAGWEIRRNRDGTTALQVVKHKSRDLYWVEWSDGLYGSYKLTDEKAYITCTPPRERRWVNVWVGVYHEASHLHYTKESAEKESHILGLGDFIATLCIERVDGRWQLVKDENA